MNFKKTAIAMAVATIAVTPAVSAQQFINTDNTGQVILFPFYNTQNGNDTYMHVVNTTEDAKAVRVTFKEHVNSDIILGFNVYLDAKDTFAFGLTSTDEGGAAVYAADATCTVPRLGSSNPPYSGTQTELANGAILRNQPFVNFLYDNEVNDSITRTSIGHAEVIEMGVVDSSIDVSDCDVIATEWSSGAWATNPATNVTSPSGGIYGWSMTINPNQAFSMAMEPTMIDGWALGSSNYHANPGSTTPNLSQGSPEARITVDGTDVVVDYTLQTNGAVHATSALLATAASGNEVVVEEVIAAETDWVMTFPTKSFYVNGTSADAPFTAVYDGTEESNVACEEVTMVQYDREATSAGPSGDFVPGDDDSGSTYSICNSMTVLRFEEQSALNVSDAKSVSYPFQAGWADALFSQKMPADDNGVVVEGLPVIGFAGTRIVNDVMSYGSATEHKTLTTTSASS